MASHETFENLVEIMDRLRDPGGCPWDREQSFATLRGYLLEECYEVVEALDREDLDALREELGDLLFQIVFLSRIGQERGAFDAADVVRGIAEKMVRRHPHVFADADAEDADTVLREWEKIKAREKGDRGGAPRRSALDGLPAPLPALPRAQRLGDRAARVGFDWPGVEPVLSQLRSEIDELAEALEAGDRDATEEELGDVLFTGAMLARHAGIDAEAALERTNRKFRRRFEELERRVAERGTTIEALDLATLDGLWQRVKRDEH